MLGSPRRSLILVIAMPLALLLGCNQEAKRSPISDEREETVVVKQSWPDGTPKLRKEVLQGTDGLVDHGTYTCWHRNGNKRYEATYVQGKLHGVAKSWHRNGQQATEEHYVHGTQCGVRTAWDEDGRKRKEESYDEDGRPHGTWTVWNGKGQVKSQQRFEHGKPAQ